jgi:3-oxoacyl-[acyl-carrier protein] reductase
VSKPIKQERKRSCPTSPEKPHSSPALPEASAEPALSLSLRPVRKFLSITAVARLKPTVSSPRYAKLAGALTQSRPLAAADGPHKLAKLTRNIVGDRLDILVANAGVSKSATIEETTIEDFDRLFAVNVRAPFFLVQQLLPILSKGSSIVLVASLAARGVVGTIPAYAATKGAIDTLVKHFASLLGARGIRVNAVAPGVVETDMSNFTKTDAGRDLALGMQALKRLAQPDDISGVVAFLASEDARWISGDTIHVDGGSKL